MKKQQVYSWAIFHKRYAQYMNSQKYEYVQPTAPMHIRPPLHIWITVEQ